MGYLRDWKGYNEALVKRGLILLDLDFVAGWSRELKAMNEGKEGGRYRYPESFIKLLAVVHAYVLPYRQLEGFMRGLSQHVDGLKAPDYTTIWWRISKMRVDLASSVALDKDVTIAVDSSGIKVSNRGEWIHKKWKVKRGFIKIHIAVDTKTKQILAIEVTREDVGDGRMLKRLVDGSSSKAVLKGVVADGAYDSKSNFRMLADRGIDPLIRVRKNASFKGGGCMPRKFAVVEQLGNADWKKERGYGYRWMVESAFSSIKRVFGEYICAVKWPNIVRELLLKASIYNLFMKMNLN
ncbi:IS5 family transposase [Candidatus Bathyarchaeota archaeon]|nr:IS5 family transposase [Candidatus Bathyarchaeota archaeon]